MRLFARKPARWAERWVLLHEGHRVVVVFVLELLGSQGSARRVRFREQRVAFWALPPAGAFEDDGSGSIATMSSLCSLLSDTGPFVSTESGSPLSSRLKIPDCRLDSPALSKNVSSAVFRLPVCKVGKRVFAQRLAGCLELMLSSAL